MSQDQLIATILSPLFATTLTAMIRRIIPRLDGPALVWGVVMVLTLLGTVLHAVVTHGSIAWAIGAGIAGGIMACGGTQIAQGVASKAASDAPQVTTAPPTVADLVELLGALQKAPEQKGK